MVKGVIKVLSKILNNKNSYYIIFYKQEVIDLIKTKKELELEQKDCADLLGISLKEYKKSLKRIKINKPLTENHKYKYDNSILELFGASEEDLKKKRAIINWIKKHLSVKYG